MPTAAETLNRYRVSGRTATMELLNRVEQRGRMTDTRPPQERIGPPSADEAEWDRLMKEQRITQEAQDKQEEDERRKERAMPTLK